MRERSERLRELIHEHDDAGARRTTFYPITAESLKQTEGEPRPIRRAKAFAHMLGTVELVVHPYELLAGSILGMWPLEPGLPSLDERRRQAIEAIERLRADKRRGGERASAHRWGSMMARDHYDANITFRDLQTLIAEMNERFADADDLSPAEIGRALEDRFQFDYGEETRRLFRELPWDVAHHLHLNYARPLRLGLGRIRDDIARRLAAAADPEKRTFYQSALIAAEALVRFVGRYAERLREEVAKPQAEPGRAAELREMAAVCGRVAEDAPQTFREALQLLWLVHIAANIGGGSALSFARFDQYMFPFYQRDIEAGRLTRDDARALLESMWLKVNGSHMRTVQSIALGGVKPDGTDGLNDLSLLCLEVCAECLEPYPNTCMRVHAGTPDEVYDRIVETMKRGIGHPCLFNDDVMVPNLVKAGYSVEDARDYFPMGCVEIMIQGRQPRWTGVGGVTFPVLLDRMLREADLDAFATFEAFLDAFCERIREHIAAFGDNAARIDERWREVCDPFASVLVDDCVERGLDIFHGGARCAPVRSVGTQGVGTAIDSLAAIRKHVFEDRRLSLADMRDLVCDDFAGREALRCQLDRRTPCFGNDIPDVDEIARRIVTAYADAVLDLNRTHPGVGHFQTVMFSYTGHVSQGEWLAATPNGRRRGETLSDALGPSQGKDTTGPTALINSVLKLDHRNITAGCAFNLKLTPTMARGAEGHEAMKNLLKTYVQGGGLQIQVNFVGQETLLDAQAHPEKHRNLIVRVAGYSERFTSLDRALQDEIISRTSHGV